MRTTAPSPSVTHAYSCLLASGRGNPKAIAVADLVGLETHGMSGTVAQRWQRRSRRCSRRPASPPLGVRRGPGGPCPAAGLRGTRRGARVCSNPPVSARGCESYLTPFSAPLSSQKVAVASGARVRHHHVRSLHKLVATSLNTDEMKLMVDLMMGDPLTQDEIEATVKVAAATNPMGTFTDICDDVYRPHPVTVLCMVFSMVHRF